MQQRAALDVFWNSMHKQVKNLHSHFQVNVSVLIYMHSLHPNIVIACFYTMTLINNYPLPNVHPCPVSRSISCWQFHKQVFLFLTLPQPGKCIGFNFYMQFIILHCAGKNPFSRYYHQIVFNTMFNMIKVGQIHPVSTVSTLV